MGLNLQRNIARSLLRAAQHLLIEVTDIVSMEYINLKGLEDSGKRMNNEHKGIKIQCQNNHFVTSGLNRDFGYEIRVLSKERLEIHCQKALIYLIDFIIDTKAVIKPYQTIAYYSWILKLVPHTDFYYDLWELVNDEGLFAEGIDYTAELISSQEEECTKRGMRPYFPTFGQKLAISKGVYEGMDCDGVRYPSPDHMTGWYITTDLYDGNIDSLMVVHYYHLAFKRPDLLTYLALPHGFRFSKYASNSEAWFDVKVFSNN
ncbi:hypothetical protein [Paenibacillus sp. N3.4]|uniref:immunity protein Imm33 domain-containing protein n=1 Tax=Paenibacillus sp. N3.4 TaxID=2603222 RepID=UPI00164F6D22|nr:hypothetical protein [Paenibacillus sp. N3.4]